MENSLIIFNKVNNLKVSSSFIIIDGDYKRFDGLCYNQLTGDGNKVKMIEFLELGLIFNKKIDAGKITNETRFVVVTIMD